MFGSFLKFANFEDFFSSLQDDDNDSHRNHNNDDDNDGDERFNPHSSRGNSDGVYILSGPELPEQDLLEDNDFDLRWVQQQR